MCVLIILITLLVYASILKSIKNNWMFYGYKWYQILILIL